MSAPVKETRIEELRAAYEAANERLAQNLDARAAGRAGTRCLSGNFAACQAARIAYEMALKEKA